MARGRSGYDEELCLIHDGTIPNLETLPKSFRSMEEWEVPEAPRGWELSVAGAAAGALLSGGSPWGALAGLSVARAIGAYLGPIRDFRIEKFRDGRGAPLLFVDGFLTQSATLEDWCEGLERAYVGRPWYRLTWESQTLAALGSAISKTAGVLRLARARSAFLFLELVRNPWHVALWKAERTGRLLGFLLARTRGTTPITMIGHSLGARVIFEALQTLGAMGRRKVNDAVLLGAAVGRKDGPPWTLAKRAARRIVNIHSRYDAVLKYLYVPGNLFLSDPAGLRPVSARGVTNIDASPLVRGHLLYPGALARLLQVFSLRAPGGALRCPSR